MCPSWTLGERGRVRHLRGRQWSAPSPARVSWSWGPPGSSRRSPVAVAPLDVRADEQRPRDITTELTYAARKEMQDVGERFAAARFPNLWQWTFAVKEDVTDELARFGLILKAGDSATYRLTELGRVWALDER